MRVSFPGVQAAAVAVLLTTTGACASGEGIESRVDGLEQELRDLRRSYALSNQRLREIDRLGETSYLLQDSIEQLGLEIEELRRMQEKTKTRVKVLEAATFTDGEAPDETPAASRRRSAPREETRPEPESDPPPAEDARSLYQKAYGAMDDDELDAAVEKFERLLQRWPKSDLADNAHYWLGEIYISLGDDDRAERQFKAILDEYPAGNKVPDALYKLGVLAADAGDTEAANTWYRKVRKEYPWSPVAEKAAERMGAAGGSE